MRQIALVVAFALVPLLAATPPAAGQPAPAALQVLQDASNDVEVQNPAATSTLPAGIWDALDLQGLSVQETPLGFVFVLQVASLQASPQQSVLASVEYEIVFRHHDTLYKIRSYLASSDIYTALERLPAGTDPDVGFGDFVADVPASVDSAANAITYEVAREWVIDSEGAQPFPGRLLDLFMVEAGFLNDARATFMGQAVTVPALEDRMPDTGAGDVPLPIQLGLAQQGTLRLASDEPFRASNGEASTFVFRVNATNLATQVATGTFATRGVPAGWDVQVPDRVRLDGNASVEVPVIVRTAFAHAHGSAASFTLELTSSDGASVGRLQVGLRYPKIAQPAGHHNTVYLHNTDDSSDPVELSISLLNRALGGGDSAKRVYFNTAEGKDDPTDAQTSVLGDTCQGLRVQDDGDTVGTTYCWYTVLSPGLEMGLDFDLGQEGTYAIPIHSLVPQLAARVQGRVVHYAPTEVPDDPFLRFFVEPTVVATLEPSDRVDIGPDGNHVFTGIIRPTPEGDLLPYERGAALAFELEVRTGRPDNFFLGPRTQPDLLPGGWLQLPLLEYEDPIDTAIGFADALHLSLDGEPQRLANPGDTLVYTMTLHNADVVAHDLSVLVAGTNREWGRLLGRPAFALPAGADHILSVAVTVPSDARDGDRADLVLEVVSQDDIGVRSLMRLVTTADTDAEHEDQSHLLASDSKTKDAPAMAPVLSLLVLLACLGARRRRQGP